MIALDMDSEPSGPPVGAAVGEVSGWLRRFDQLRRIVVCRPEMAAAVQAAVDRSGVAGLYEVVASEYAPAGQIYVIAKPALDLDFVTPTLEAPDGR